MTFDDVERLATSLPDVEEGTSYGRRAWKVKGKTFAWERPLTRKEQGQLTQSASRSGTGGPDAPDGPILGVRVEHLVAKEAVIAEEDACFTTPHFTDFAAVLVRLDDVAAEVLDELITDSWLTMAPKATAADFLAAQGD